jgi:diguanylate cyclase (GGDEF)-like protein
MGSADIGGWEIWKLPRRAQWFVLATELAAAVGIAIAADRATWQPRPVLVFAVFIVSGLIGVEGFRRVGAMHQGSDRPFHSMLSAFFVAAVLILPPVYAVLLPLPVHAVVQARALRLQPVKRIFNTAMIVLACLAATAVRGALGPGPESDLGQLSSMSGARGVGSVLLSAAVLVAVNEALLIGLLRQVAPTTPWRSQLGDRQSWTLNSVDVCAGVLMAAAWVVSPLFYLIGLAPVLFLQRSVVYWHLVGATQTDAKTGAATSTHWRTVAGRTVTRAHHDGASVAVLMIDLDHFKLVNDTYGHLIGDEVLIAVAASLRLSVRPGDLVGRFGGEEFTVLLARATLPEAMAAATRINDRIRTLHLRESDDTTPRVTASIGVAVFGHHGIDLDDLLAAADRALFEAKRAGRDQIRLGADRLSDDAVGVEPRPIRTT